jgi:hypothetical protein
MMGTVNPIVIVASCESYRTGDFIAAARAQRLPVVIATDAASPFDEQADRTVLVDLDNPSTAGGAVAASVPSAVAVVAIDDQGVEVAAEAARLLGHPTNPMSAIHATRDKLAMRRLLDRHGVPQPSFQAVDVGELPSVAADLGTPLVAKPTSMAASRGVIRVDSHEQAAPTEERIRSILEVAGRDRSEPLIAETYVDGAEMVVEGLMVEGTLRVLALIDKPVPLVGPFFEETMFVSPSRQPSDVQDRVVATVRGAVVAIGLSTGPVHAEVRIDSNGTVWIIEIAARSIGGLCGRSLTFGLLAEPLESVIIRSATGRTSRLDTGAKPATGVLMLPIPGSGTLNGVEGIADAAEVSGIDNIEITIPIGRQVVPLPEGDRYLGFVFASGHSPAEVERSLATAAGMIDPVIDGEFVASQGHQDARDAR